MKRCPSFSHVPPAPAPTARSQAREALTKNASALIAAHPKPLDLGLATWVQLATVGAHVVTIVHGAMF